MWVPGMELTSSRLWEPARTFKGLKSTETKAEEESHLLGNRAPVFLTPEQGKG